MIVRELIDRLNLIERKDLPIGVRQIEMRMGGSRTGIYNGGEECVSITGVELVGADELAALNDLDTVEHIEITIADVNDY